MNETRPELTAVEAGNLAGRILDEIERAVIGKRPALEIVLMALLSNGHVLIEDFPGLAKTLMARSFAQVSDLTFTRIQFTPDLMPMDITGSALRDPSTGDLVFRPGPIFTNLLLADEVNRAPAKTQAALLEAMEERQVTSDGVTRTLDSPFLVIATQNPIEYEGTYPLPEAQLDRFLARIGIGYPSRDDEWRVVADRIERRADNIRLDAVATSASLAAMRAAAEAVFVSEAIGRYMVDLARSTREHPQVYVGASPRGSLALMKLARACAVLEGRDFVIPDDVKRVATAALSHRLLLLPELWVQNVRGEDIVAECLSLVPAPSVSDVRRRVQ